MYVLGDIWLKSVDTQSEKEMVFIHIHTQQIHFIFTLALGLRPESTVTKLCYYFPC